MRIHSRITRVGLLASIRFLLGGCVLLSWSGNKVIGVIPREPGSNVVLRTVLPRTANSIWFRATSADLSFRGEDRVAITLTNTSSKRTISQQIPGAFAAVAPHNSAPLYDGRLTALLEGRRLEVSAWGGRASCVISFQFVLPVTFPAPIQVLCHYSSPPL